jgi:hypothetical protein
MKGLLSSTSIVKCAWICVFTSWIRLGVTRDPRTSSSADFGKWTFHPESGTPVLDAQLVVRRSSSIAGYAVSRYNRNVPERSRNFESTAMTDLEDRPFLSEREPGVVPLFGDLVNVGGYYLPVYIGGQLIHVMVDTGSGMLLVPSTTCQTCPTGADAFDVRDSLFSRGRPIQCDDSICGSDTCSPLTCGACSARNSCCATTNRSLCGFHLTYGDQSVAAGWLVRDYLAWGELSFPTVFGAMELASPKFEIQPVDGILGLGYPALACAPSCIEPVFDAMARNLTMKTIFQLCMTEDSGRLVLGHYDITLGKTTPIWVPLAMNQPPDFFNVRLIGDLMVNGKAANLPRFQRGIVDSGTTLVMLSPSGFVALASYMQQNFCSISGLCGAASWFQPAGCARLTASSLDRMPTLTFQLQGFDIVLSPRDYMIDTSSVTAAGYRCLSIMEASLPSGVDIIFGIPIMRKYVIVYDREQSRLGFAESLGTCEYGNRII